MTYVFDSDDLYDGVAERSWAYLNKVKERVPGFLATLFTIPQRTSDATIAKFKNTGWIALAPHGWRHTRGECLPWNVEEATIKIIAARDRGIDAPAFRAPAWLLTADTYEACKELGITVCDHKDFHSYVPGTMVYRYNSVDGRAPKVRPTHTHLTDCAVDNFIANCWDDGRLAYHQKATFAWPWDVAVPNPIEEAL